MNKENCNACNSKTGNCSVHIGKLSKHETNNICIGHNSGINLTDEVYQLCLKCDELDIDIQETMSNREYELISKVVKVISFYNEKNKNLGIGYNTMTDLIIVENTRKCPNCKKENDHKLHCYIKCSQCSELY